MIDLSVLPVLLFQGGTHGNFLSRCLSISSGEGTDFSFYANKNGAHNNTGYDTKIVNHVHDYHVHGGLRPGDHWLGLQNNDIWTYINVDTDDLYVLYWHILFAAGEFGVNVLELKNFNMLEQLVNDKKIHLVVQGGLKDQVNIFKDNSTIGLREMFKRSFSEKNGILSRQIDILNEHKISNIFKFSWFYKWEDFEKQIEVLLVSLGYSFKVDIKHHWQEFVDRKQNIICSKQLVEQAFKCYSNRVSMDISSFCIYEQAYLDYLIEKHLGYEIENYIDYPRNTQDIYPIKAWEGIRYEL